MGILFEGIKFYILIMTIVWGKGGIVLKGGHDSRKYGSCLFNFLKMGPNSNQEKPSVIKQFVAK